MSFTLVQLAEERQRVLGRRYLLPDGGNAATKRNFYLDIAEELADIWVIAAEARKRSDVVPWLQVYLRSMQILAEYRGGEALELAELYGHDDIPVERVIPQGVSVK